MKKVLTWFAMAFTLNSYAQTDIYELMERRDIRLSSIDSIAQQYFNQAGTGRGSGYKQYQRWYYEQSFHLDRNGYLRPGQEEFDSYKAAISQMPSNSYNITAEWTELGPMAWAYTSGWNPGVGRITSVAVNPSDTTIIYVSSPGGGIWKSSNSGSTWSPLIDFVNSSWMNVFNLCIDPSDPNIIYAALSSGGVIKSVNAGLLWSATGAGPSGSKKVLVHPSNSNIVFATASNGIYRSVNGGSSWTQVHSNSSKEDIEFNPSEPNIMYASGSGGTSSVWRSVDNGVSWTAITIANGITNTGRTLLGVSPADPNVVYAVQASGSLFGRLYRSNDAGQTYSTTITGNPASGTNFFGYESSGTGTTGQATYDMGITVNPENVNELIIAGIICWRSGNGGTNFSPLTQWYYPNALSYNHADVHALEWVNKTVYSGSDGGVYKSLNKGSNWTDLSAGLSIRQFYKISCAKTDANVITTGAQDNGSSFRRTNGIWVDWLGADGMDNMISPTNAGIAIGTSQNGSIYKTTNSGASYFGLPKPPGGNWVTPLFMHPTNHDTLYGGWQGVYRSGDGGNTWTDISAGVITTNVDVLAVSKSNPQYIYASDNNVLYATSDAGTSWNMYFVSGNITAICVSPLNPEKIWITTSSASANVLVSVNAGFSFTDISAGLPLMAARSVDVLDNVEESVYVGMNIGVYYRDNINTSWVEHASGLPLVAINEVEIHRASMKLRVATYGRGIWESPLRITASLPVKWLSVTATQQNDDVMIKWEIENETSGTRYEVERSMDGSTFAKLAEISARNSGGTTGSSQYHLLDEWPVEGYNFYRIREIAANGHSSYSNIVKISIKPENCLISISPNPVMNGQLRISINGQFSGSYSARILSASGIQHSVFRSSARSASYDISRLKSGLYILEIEMNNKICRRTFIK